MLRHCFLLLFISFGFLNGYSQTKSTLKVKTTVNTVPKTNKKTVPEDTVPNPYYIIIDKSDYELQVYDDSGWLSTYPVVFGSKDLGDKMKEGDKKTPNGEFKVILKKTHKNWGLELLLDYPTDLNKQLFEERKAKGLIAKKAKIGNGIAIHGTMPDSDWTVDSYVNWTDGCISLKSDDMRELYEIIREGTRVTIKP